MTNRDELFAAMGGSKPVTKKPSGSPMGPKQCTDACIKIEAKEAAGCICYWRCWKETQHAKTKHVRAALDPRCVVHSKWAFKKYDGE